MRPYVEPPRAIAARQGHGAPARRGCAVTWASVVVACAAGQLLGQAYPSLAVPAGWILAAAALAGGLSLIAALRRPGAVLAAEVRRRRAAEAELRSERDTFEVRVRERTVELERLNAALRRREAHLTYLANHDGLTGLPNRTLFRDLLRQELERVAPSGGCFALVIADLDRFKPINDRYGHAAGDRLLVDVARRMAGAVRASDIVARLGGDEFAILMRSPSDRQALGALTARVKGAVEAPTLVGGREVSVGVSLGGAIFPEDAAELDLLFERADHSLYLAKATAVALNDEVAAARSPAA